MLGMLYKSAIFSSSKSLNINSYLFGDESIFPGDERIRDDKNKPGMKKSFPGMKISGMTQSFLVLKKHISDHIIHIIDSYLNKPLDYQKE